MPCADGQAQLPGLVSLCCPPVAVIEYGTAQAPRMPLCVRQAIIITVLGRVSVVLHT
jgi:hypothetical protein